MNLERDYHELFYKSFSEYVCTNYEDISMWISGDELSSICDRFPFDLENNNIAFLWILKGLNILSSIRGEEWSEEFISTSMARIHEVLVKKNSDYGNSALSIPVLSPTTPVYVAILCRMSDKISRYYSIRDKQTVEVNETIEETISDFIGYAVLLWLAVYGDEQLFTGKVDELVLVVPQEMTLEQILEKVDRKKFYIYQGKAE